MIYDKTRILLNPFVGLLLGCKSSYIKVQLIADICACPAVKQCVLVSFITRTSLNYLPK